MADLNPDPQFAIDAWAYVDRLEHEVNEHNAAQNDNIHKNYNIDMRDWKRLIVRDAVARLLEAGCERPVKSDAIHTPADV